MPTYTVQNPNQKGLANVLSDALSALGPALMPDPAGDAKAGLINTQTQAAKASTAKDQLEAAKIALQTGALGKLPAGIKFIKNPDGTMTLDPASAQSGLGQALVAGLGSGAIGDFLGGVNRSAEPNREHQFKQQDAAAEAAAALELQNQKPIQGSPGGKIWPNKQALLDDIATQGGAAPAPSGAPAPAGQPAASPLAATMAGGQPDLNAPMPDPLGEEQIDPATGMPIVEAPLPVQEGDPQAPAQGLPEAPVEPSAVASTMAGGAPVYSKNSVSLPAKMTNNSNMGTKPIPVQTAAGVVGDLKLLKQVQDLRARLNPDNDPNSPYAAEANANRGAFHAIAGKVLPGAALDAYDKKGQPYRAALALMANTTLHDLSGAAVTDPEWQRLAQSIANPQDLDWSTAANKLAEAEAHLKKNLGVTASYFSPSNGYVTNTQLEPFYGGMAPAGVPSATSPASAGGAPTPPPPGHQEGGYEFTGGNPSDPANWKKLP